MSALSPPQTVPLPLPLIGYPNLAPREEVQVHRSPILKALPAKGEGEGEGEGEGKVRGRGRVSVGWGLG